MKPPIAGRLLETDMQYTPLAARLLVRYRPIDPPFVVGDVVVAEDCHPTTARNILNWFTRQVPPSFAVVPGTWPVQYVRL
jgi:hypothetical protein